ncbi:hypothetical protein C0J52_14771, partial [Blattella germanica]
IGTLPYGKTFVTSSYIPLKFAFSRRNVLITQLLMYGRILTTPGFTEINLEINEVCNFRGLLLSFRYEAEMEVGWAYGETSTREMGARSYNVGYIYREERTSKTQMGRHIHSRSRKTMVKTSKRQKKWKELANRTKVKLTYKSAIISSIYDLYNGVLEVS